MSTLSRDPFHASPPAATEASAELGEAERARILAKAALFAPPPAQLADGRRDLVGLSREELAAEMVAIGEKPFRAKQLWHWTYHQGATDFGRMHTVERLRRGESRDLTRMSRIGEIEDDKRPIRALRGNDEPFAVVGYRKVA